MGEIAKNFGSGRPWGQNWEEVTNNLVAIGRRRARLLRSPDGDLWGEFQNGSRPEVHRLQPSRDDAVFVQWWVKTYFEEYKAVPSKQCQRAALDVLKGFAQSEEVQPIAIRTAEHEGQIFIDLTNNGGQIVKTSSSDWTVTTDAPVIFCCPRGAYALPHPVRGGTLLELRSFVPHLNDFEWHLLIIWLLNALQPRGPHPILALGEEGGLLLIKMLSRLVDPSSHSLRGAPKDLRDVTAAVAHSWFVNFAELVSLSPGAVGELSRAARGGGFSARKNFSDYDEYGFQATSPIAWWSRAPLAVFRDDLNELTFFIDPKQTEEPLTDEIPEGFERAVPRILGALLDGMACGLRNEKIELLDVGSVLSPCLRWAVACAEGCGIDPSKLKQAFFQNQLRTQRAITGASGMVGPLRALMSEEKAYFKGSATDLFNALKDLYSEDAEEGPFPPDQKQLSRLLLKLQKAFRSQGIFITRDRTPDHSGRFIEIANYDVKAAERISEVDWREEVDWDLIPERLPGAWSPPLVIIPLRTDDTDDSF